MSKLKWEDEIFSIGIEPLDTQHKALVGFINALDEYKQRADKEYLVKVINTLVEYTQTHFIDEEKLMKKFNYSKLEEHKRHHQLFIDKIKAAEENFEKSDDYEDLLNDIIAFLSHWLANHILVEDKEYVRELMS